MNIQINIKDIATILSIVGLLTIGLTITLKSGVVSVKREQFRLILGNMSKLAFTLAGGAVFFLMVQQIVGFPTNSHW